MTAYAGLTVTGVIGVKSVATIARPVRTRVVLLAAVVVGTACAHGRTDLRPSDTERVGILVMAHGGTPDWNAAVEEAVAPLRSFTPTVVAFGMGVPDSLQQAVRELERQGVTRIVGVRLFVSIESFRHRIEYLLGARPDPPMPPDTRALREGNAPSADPRRSDGFAPIMSPVETSASIVLNREGLSQSPTVGDILLERVLAQSESPRTESVLILAHGMADDRSNDRLISEIDRLADRIRAARAFRAVSVQTLREDWEEKRVLSEQRIRDFVERGNRDEGRVIVVSFRLYGFGPYGKVLDGMRYIADRIGLLPHPTITEWITRQTAETCSRAHWTNPFEG